MAPPLNLLQDPILANAPEVDGYRVLPPCVLYARLGHGGMGAVYLGKHMGLFLPKAVKVMHMWHHPDAGAEFIERFRREAQIGDTLSHENLVKVNTVDSCGNLHYLVMEYVEGEDVNARVARRGAMTEVEALTTILFAARGLGYAHEHGIVHRDIKPANLMLSVRGDVKVTDLGLARARDITQAMSGTHGPMGTPLFMAPEQWETSKVGAEADVWALGATLYFLLAGRCHLSRDTAPVDIRRVCQKEGFPDLAQVRDGVSEQARAVIARCTAIEPKDRFGDARALEQELRRLVPGEKGILADPGAKPGLQRTEPSNVEVSAIRGKLATPTPLREDVRRTDESTQPLRAGSTPVPGSTTGTQPQTLVQPGPNPRPSGFGLRWAGAVLVAAAGIAAFLWFRPVDPESLRLGGVAAREERRFGEAVAAFLALELVPGRGEQARSLLQGVYRDWIDELQRNTNFGEACFQARAWQQTTTRMTEPEERGREKGEAAQSQVADLERLVRGQLEGKCSVASPTKGQWFPDRRVPVQLTVFRGVAVRVGDREVPVGRDLQVETTWTITGQDDQVAIVFRHERAGVELPITIPVHFKENAATVAFTPGMKRLTREPRLQLTGTLTNGPARITIEHTPPAGPKRTVDPDTNDGTSFTKTIELPLAEEGEHRFVAVAVDQTGRDTRSGEFTLLADRTPPLLQQIEAPARTQQRKVSIKGKSSEKGFVFVSGAAPDQRLAVAAGELFSLDASLDVPQNLEADKPCEVTLVAEDEAGNQSTPGKAEVVFDALAPTLRVSSPAAGNRIRRKQPVPVAGTASEPGCRIGPVGGEPKLFPGTAFELQVAAPEPREDGTGILKLRVVDAAERENEVTIQVAFEPDNAGPGTNNNPPSKPLPTWADPASATGEPGPDGLHARLAVRADPKLWLGLVRPTNGKPPFYLGETEVSWAQWRVYVREQLKGVAPPQPRFLWMVAPGEEWKRASDASWDDPMPGLWPRGDATKEFLPVTQVSGVLAEAFCKSRQLRLPRTDEWTMACELQGLGFGWTPKPGAPAVPLKDRANIADASFDDRLARLGKTGYAFYPSVKDDFPFLAPVGTFPRGQAAPPLGLYDLLGNVAEWCFDAGRGRIVARGGSWAQDQRGVDRSKQEGEHDKRFDPQSGYDAVGFRVAGDVPP